MTKDRNLKSQPKKKKRLKFDSRNGAVKGASVERRKFVSRPASVWFIDSEALNSGLESVVNLDLAPISPKPIIDNSLS